MIRCYLGEQHTDLMLSFSSQDFHIGFVKIVIDLKNGVEGTIRVQLQMIQYIYISD